MYRQSQSSWFMGQTEGSQTCVQLCSTNLNIGTAIVWPQPTITLNPRASGRPGRVRGPTRLSCESLYQCRWAKTLLLSDQLWPGHVTAPLQRVAESDPIASWLYKIVRCYITRSIKENVTLQ